MEGGKAFSHKAWVPREWRGAPGLRGRHAFPQASEVALAMWGELLLFTNLSVTARKACGLTVKQTGSWVPPPPSPHTLAPAVGAGRGVVKWKASRYLRILH